METERPRSVELDKGDGKAAPSPNTPGSKQYLKEAYTQGKRNFEIFSMVSAVAMMMYVIARLSWFWEFATPLDITVSIVGGILFADFGTGFLHWLCDSYGSVDMPIFGKAFIRSFREHHIDPLAITRHDYIECNGDNCMIVALTMTPFVGLTTFGTGETIAKYYNVALFFTIWSFFIAFTNQFHKWSHTRPAGLPKWVQFLQEWRIILPRQVHHVHHVAPHATYFCITTGWLNYPLDRLRFWQGVEFVIELTTGYKARDDDKAWMAKDR